MASDHGYELSTTNSESAIHTQGHRFRHHHKHGLVIANDPRRQPLSHAVTQTPLRKSLREQP